MLRHTGTTFGFISLLTLFPDLNLGFYTTMTGNDDHYIFRTLLHNYMADVALGVEPWLSKQITFVYIPFVQTSLEISTLQ